MIFYGRKKPVLDPDTVIHEGRSTTVGRTSVLFSHLGRKVAAKFELLQRDGHGVGAEEQDEGHERQIGDKLAGASHQLATVFQTLFLAELTPVESCYIHLGEDGTKTDRRRRESERSERVGMKVRSIHKNIAEKQTHNSLPSQHLSRVNINTLL